MLVVFYRARKTPGSGHPQRACGFDAASGEEKLKNLQTSGAERARAA
jgi:hypothetical protein